jgi:endoglycosylceramidase
VSTERAQGIARRQPSYRGRPACVVLVALTLTVLTSACGSEATGLAAPGVTAQFSARSAYNTEKVNPTRTTLSGRIEAPGGPFLRDRSGRVVFLHGVNAVYKYPPFELSPDPTKPWNFDAGDARRIAGLGFNVVRLGVLWQALEPGTGGPNQPSVCAPGAPGDPRLFNAAVARNYLAKVKRTVDLLGRYHVYTLLDMHQDVYNQVFRGEGAPAWAVCTGLVPVFALPGRWSTNYANPGLDAAVNHFWRNDVIGDLQGQFDMVWGTVAHYFSNDRWIVGYDPYNEPFSLRALNDDGRDFAVNLECFYTGSAHPGLLGADNAPITCPPDDPAQGVIGTIEAADPHHLVFIEPDNYTVRHAGFDLLGAMDYPRLVYNFHIYCGERNPHTGDPTNLKTCLDHEVAHMVQRMNGRLIKSAPDQPGGPAWYMSEFGATHSVGLVGGVTSYANALDLGWAYWSWKYYNDPTGSSFEALVNPSGHLEPTATVLSQTYPEAAAGTPHGFSFSAATGDFSMTYTPSRRVRAPTIVFVADAHYRAGYCATARGGRIVSHPGDVHLLVDNSRGARAVTVTVRPGPCPQRG